MSLDGVVEALAISRGIVEAELGRKDVVPEIVEARVPGRSLAQLEHAVEQFRQRPALLDVRLRGRPEGALSNSAVRTLEEWLQLGERALLTFPFDRHRARDALIACAELLQLGEERNVRLAEDLDRGAEAGEGRRELGRGVARFHQPPSQLDAALLHLRHDLGGEPKVVRLFVGVGRVDRIGDHRDRGRFGHQLFQRGPGLQPALDRAGVDRPLGQLVEEGGNVVPSRFGERTGRGRQYRGSH